MVIRLAPDDADAYYGRGLATHELGQHSAAIADYDEAIRLNKNDAEVYVVRGIVKAELGQWSVAILDFDEVIRLAPDDALAYYLRGLAWNKLHCNQRARKDLKTALQLATRTHNQSLKTSIEKVLRQLDQ